MFIPNQKDIYNWDKFTIERDNISSIELMKQAAKACTDQLLLKEFSFDRDFVIFAGSGNNGGDGLAMAILLRNAFYNVKVYQCHIGDWSQDNILLQEEIKGIREINYQVLQRGDLLPLLSSNEIVIDALFGIGINRPVDGYWAELIDHINSSKVPVYSVDVPSGLNIDQKSSGSVIEASTTYSFQSMKYAYFIPENEKYTGEIELVDIGLHPDYKVKSKNKYLILKVMQNL